MHASCTQPPGPWKWFCRGALSFKKKSKSGFDSLKAQSHLWSSEGPHKKKMAHLFTVVACIFGAVDTDELREKT